MVFNMSETNSGGGDVEVKSTELVISSATSTITIPNIEEKPVFVYISVQSGGN